MSVNEIDGLIDLIDESVNEIDGLIDLIDEAMDGLDPATVIRALDEARALAMDAREAIDCVREKLGYPSVLGRSLYDIAQEYV